MKIGIQSHQFMANRWGNNGHSGIFIFLGSKIIADGDYSHEIKRCLLLRRKAMTNLDSVLKSRDKVHIVQAIVFPVIMYGCESWTIKKAEHWRINAFKLWHWRRLLRVPWTARRSNQSILKEISPEHSLKHSRPSYPSPSPSLLRFMPIEPVIPSNHLILCHLFLLLPSVFPSIRVFSNESGLCIRWPKYWSFSISPSGLISIMIDWFDLLAV